MLCSLAAVALMAIATGTLWWYGCFLPGWIQWKAYDATLGGTNVQLKNRRLTIRNGGPDGNIVWKTQADWFVQDLVIKDIDRDGEEEMILLVWKHGNYGNHMPFWIKKNDKALKQHIYIYKFDETREKKTRAIWMSSQIAYEITGISSGEKSFLNVSDCSGNMRVWMWRDFGLKLVR